MQNPFNLGCRRGWARFGTSKIFIVPKYISISAAHIVHTSLVVLNPISNFGFGFQPFLVLRGHKNIFNRMIHGLRVR